jgi:hypothetical protein
MTFGLLLEKGSISWGAGYIAPDRLPSSAPAGAYRSKAAETRHFQRFLNTG